MAFVFISYRQLNDAQRLRMGNVDGAIVHRRQITRFPQIHRFR